MVIYLKTIHLNAYPTYDAIFIHGAIFINDCLCMSGRNNKWIINEKQTWFMDF